MAHIQHLYSNTGRKGIEIIDSVEAAIFYYDTPEETIAKLRFLAGGKVKRVLVITGEDNIAMFKQLVKDMCGYYETKSNIE